MLPYIRYMDPMGMAGRELLTAVRVAVMKTTGISSWRFLHGDWMGFIQT